MNERQLLVLVVEDEGPLAAFYQLDLTQRGHRVNVVHSAEHALEVLTPEYDVVVTDLRLPEMTGEGLIMALRAHPFYAAMPVLVIAADHELPVAVRDAATRFRRKPFDLERFADYVTETAGAPRVRN